MVESVKINCLELSLKLQVLDLLKLHMAKGQVVMEQIIIKEAMEVIKEVITREDIIITVATKVDIIRVVTIKEVIKEDMDKTKEGMDKTKEDTDKIKVDTGKIKVDITRVAITRVATTKEVTKVGIIKVDITKEVTTEGIDVRNNRLFTII